MPALLLCATDTDDPQLDRYVAAADRRGLAPVVVRDAAACAEATVSGVVAVRRRDALLAADMARALGLPWHAPEAVRLSVNRLHVLGRLTAAGIPVPRFTSLDVVSGEGFERLAGVPGPWRVTAAPDEGHGTPPAATTGSPASERQPAMRVLEDAHALEAYVAARRSGNDGAAGEGGVLIVEPVLATAGWLVVGLIDAGALRVVGIVDVDDVGPQRGRWVRVPTALARDAQAHLGGLVALACARIGLCQGPVVALAGAVEGRACLVDIWPGTLEAPASDLLLVVGPSMAPVALEDLVVRHAVGDALDGYALDSGVRTMRLET